MPDNTIHLIATATFGLEAIVKREAISLGFSDIKASDGRVDFKCGIHDIARSNLWFRCKPHTAYRTRTS